MRNRILILANYSKFSTRSVNCSRDTSMKKLMVIHKLLSAQRKIIKSPNDFLGNLQIDVHNAHRYYHKNCESDQIKIHEKIEYGQIKKSRLIELRAQLNCALLLSIFLPAGTINYFPGVHVCVNLPQIPSTLQDLL